MIASWIYTIIFSEFFNSICFPKEAIKNCQLTNLYLWTFVQKLIMLRKKINTSTAETPVHGSSVWRFC
jgi:hypothetical protein